MKKLRALVSIICCMAMLFSTAVCMAETTEPAEELFSGFMSTLDYVSEKDGTITCNILVEALEGSFKADVTAEEMIVKVHEITDEEYTEDFNPEEEYADVSEVTVVSNDGAVLEVSFVMPVGELNVNEFAIQGYVALADGVMLDEDGNSVGKIAELTVWEMNESDRGTVTTEHDYEYSYLKLMHSGVYVAEFYVYWDQFIEYDAQGNMIFMPVKWEGNGDNKTAGFTTEFELTNAYNIKVMARVSTGLLWQPWITVFERSGLEFEYAELEIMGTTFKPSAEFRLKK